MQKNSFGYLLRNYAWPMRGRIFFLVLIILLANFMVAIQPAVLAGITNVIVPPDGATPENGHKSLLDLNRIGTLVLNNISRNSADKWEILFILASIFMVLIIFASIFNFIAYLLSLRIEAKVQKMIQADILKHLLSLNIDFFNHQKSGDLISRIIQDGKSTANGIGSLVQSLLQHTGLILIYSTYLFNTNTLLTLVAFVLIFFQFSLSELLKKPIAKAVRKQFEMNGSYLSMLNEVFTSIRIIKCFGGESYELERLKNGMASVVKSDIKAGTVKHFQEPTRSILDSFAIIGIILMASHQLINGQLSVQGFAMFIFVGQSLVTPINKLAVSVSWIYALVASYSRINEIRQISPNVVNGSIKKQDFKSDIILDSIRFSYGNADVLRDISFSIEKGEIVAIVGPSGAGKSTLIDLLLRFYDPGEGDIYIDRINLRSIDFNSYRRIFGVVPQQNMLFNDTIRNNILYGRNYLNDEDVRMASRIANADKFIEELPRGYDTIVGEKGVLLSGGQCQRLSIARAVVARPDVLILDEATSSLDSESEQQVQKAIDKVLENSTAIVIAHRLSTILHAHKIIVLKSGEIEAIGSHNDLLVKSSTYQLLYNLQFKNVKIANGE